MHDAPTVVFTGGGTGGHLYPALALADELVKERPEVRPVFIGANRGIESRVLPNQGREYNLLPVRGWKRGNVLTNLGVPWALFKSIVAAVAIHRKYDSKLVVVTGGYSSAPAGVAAAVLGIPIVLQEQNALPGVTTRVLSLWAKQIHVAFPKAISGLPLKARDAVLTSGCPIQSPKEFGFNREEICDKFGLDPELKTLLVTGGSQGSVALNKLILGNLQKQNVQIGDFFCNWQILWITGTENYEAINKKLIGLPCSARVKMLPYVETMPWVLKIADLAVSRSGAMTTSEFLAWGVPSILVPLPTAAANHQELNALAIQGLGAALHLTQGDLDSGKLWREILQLTENGEKLKEMAKKALENAQPEATSNIVNSMLELLPKYREGSP
ncbi:MAG: undecaprenyldiphospho-muramoylpentapeptide beta-N-acetylglucosaminyltransferase [Gemmatimonadetes bacterium]|nr:undecaprenyldiphospho-muramoylpentapeptide beta-N-acetylglucosaminyltransferase [Gemmatimonadota bacterium]